MPPESGGSQFLDTGTAIGLFTLAIVLILKTILPYLTKYKPATSAVQTDLTEQLKVIITSIAKLHEVIEKIRSQIDDLFRWHKPIRDPITNQPKFMWYGDWELVKQELHEQRAIIDDLRRIVCEEKKLDD